MSRPHIEYPETHDEWVKLPDEFKNFVDDIDKVRDIFECNSKGLDYLYYNWQVDDKVPLTVLISHWNYDGELPEYNVIIDDIIECISEENHIAYYTSI